MKSCATKIYRVVWKVNVTHKTRGAMIYHRLKEEVEDVVWEPLIPTLIEEWV